MVCMLHDRLPCMARCQAGHISHGSHVSNEVRLVLAGGYKGVMHLLLVKQQPLWHVLHACKTHDCFSEALFTLIPCCMQTCAAYGWWPLLLGATYSGQTAAIDCFSTPFALVLVLVLASLLPCVLLLVVLLAKRFGLFGHFPKRF